MAVKKALRRAAWLVKQIEKARRDLFEQAVLRDMPIGGPDDLVGMGGNLRLVVDMVKTEIDLIDEGQDGTDPRLAPRLKRWLAKWEPIALECFPDR